MRAPLVLLTLGAVTAADAQVASPAAGPGDSSWVAAYPDQARDSIRAWLAATAAAGSAERAALLRRAEQLGLTYLRAWGDSYPLGDVRRFTGWSPAQRALRLRADSLRRAGNAAIARTGAADAMRLWHASARLARRLGDSATIAGALGNIGAGFYREGELDSAEYYFGRAHRLAEGAGDRRTMVNALGGLASVSKDRGDLVEAAARYRQALEVRRQVGDFRGIAADANNLGLVAAATGDESEARRRHEEALATARGHGLDEPAAAALVNLAALESLDGDDTAAERLYREALALYRRLDDPAFEALVLHDLGRLASGRGDYPAAADRLRKALVILDRTGPAEYAVSAQMDLALVLAAMGRLDEADDQLRTAEATARSNELGIGTLGYLHLARGSLALQLNQLRAARNAYLGGLSLLRADQDPAGEAEALSALGGLSLTEGDYPAARDQLASAAIRQASAGDTHAAALTRLLAARALRALGDTAAARRTIADALDTLRASHDRVGEAWALCQAGDLQREAALPLAAEATYRRGIERLGRRASPEVAACLFGGLGLTLRERGAGRQAIAELQRGIAAVEEAAGSARAAGRRADYLSDKWALYTDLALAQRAAGDDAGAFATSERLRARQTLDAIGSRSGERTGAAADPRAVALRRRITALMSTATGSRTGAALRGADALERLPNERREALAQAQDAYAALLDSLDRAKAAVNSHAPAGTPGWREVAARLPADAALVEYLVTDSAAIAFVVRRSGVAAVDLPLNAARLGFDVDFVRGVLADREHDRGAERASLARLRRGLIAPLEAAGLLAGARRLVIVPHRELHYLPFAALAEAGPRGRYLIEQYQLSRAPSAAVWLRLEVDAPRRGSPSLLAVAPLGPDLPGAGAEVAAIARMYGDDAEVLTGAGATRAALAAAAPRHAIVHLATLGVLNRHNPLFSFVELAPSDGSDGRLEVHDVARLRLDAQLVVLSACQTALGSGRLADVPPGDDWVGLVGAFHAAGAEKVLATLWPVDDEVTARLMTRFHAELRAGRPAAAALAAAQRSVLADARTRSPFYWAGFVLDGSL